jgi:hypothetical protein
VNTSGRLATLTGPRTVNVDLTGIAAGTTATLYFDLLGFGSQSDLLVGKITIEWLPTIVLDLLVQ